MYDSGTSISARVMLLIAIAAFSIWFVHSRVWCNCFLEFSLRPSAATRGTGSHHFSSCRWSVLRKEAEPSASGAITPWSTYQNSVLVKLSNTSYIRKDKKRLLNDFQKWKQYIMKQSRLELTRSILSSLRSAGRFIKRSDLGLQVMTYRMHQQ